MRRILQTASDRCSCCRLPPRWCVCPAARAVECALAVDVVVHHREEHRPSSTSRLIQRLVPGARRWVWRRERALSAPEVLRAERELWILHPSGEPLSVLPDPRDVQVLLLDGSWPETSAMAQEVSGWGRRIALPMTGESRYWLRAQQDAGRFSTVEALLFVLAAFGLQDAEHALRCQFELQVYAGLRARGQKERAAAFLRDSPAREALPEFLSELNRARPR